MLESTLTCKKARSTLNDFSMFLCDLLWLQSPMCKSIGVFVCECEWVYHWWCKGQTSEMEERIFHYRFDLRGHTHTCTHAHTHSLSLFFSLSKLKGRWPLVSTCWLQLSHSDLSPLSLTEEVPPQICSPLRCWLQLCLVYLDWMMYPDVLCHWHDSVVLLMYIHWKINKIQNIKMG